MAFFRNANVKLVSPGPTSAPPNAMEHDTNMITVVAGPATDPEFDGSYLDPPPPTKESPFDVLAQTNTFSAAAKAITAMNKTKPRIQNEVRPFTRESLEKINLRTRNLIRDYGFLPRRSPNIPDGAQLPMKYEPFPNELLGKPVEEIDQYVYEKVGQCTRSVKI